MPQSNAQSSDNAFNKYLKYFGHDESASPLGADKPLKSRLKDAKQKIQVIKDVFEKENYRNFTKYSIGIFERWVSQYFLDAVQRILSEKEVSTTAALM